VIDIPLVREQLCLNYTQIGLLFTVGNVGCLCIECDINVILLSIGFFGSSIPSGVVWTLATDVAPRRYVGGALAPLVTGIVTQSTGSFNLAFVIASIFAVFAAISYFVILKGPIQPEANEVEAAA